MASVYKSISGVISDLKYIKYDVMDTIPFSCDYYEADWYWSRWHLGSYLPITWNLDDNEYVETLIGVCDAILVVFTKILYDVDKMKWSRSILDDKDNYR